MILTTSLSTLEHEVLNQTRLFRHQLARRIRIGNVGHSGRLIDWWMPFGGFKQFGLGRERRAEGYEQFVEQKTSYIDQWQLG